jgi:hypothetical protein
MLHIPQPTPGKAKISGTTFARFARHSTAAERALLAVDLVRGLVEISDLTPGQARQLLKAGAGYFATAAKLSVAERRQIEQGAVSLSSLHHNNTPSDLDIDRFIRRAGANRVLAGLDRYTQPQLPPVAAR